MARALYTALWWVALPLLPLRLWWRGRHEPGYRERIGERYGRYRADAPRPTGDVVWIHAVSLGETRAAAPLVARVLRERPLTTVLLTHMTATGRAAGAALYGERVVQAWLPYDVPFAIRAFLARFRPRAGLLMETELWPNLAAACRAAGMPLFLVNARLSEKSAAGYARIGALSRPLLQSLAGIAAQSSADAQRLEALGARDVAVTGNLKFDVEVPAAALAAGHALRAGIGATRPVWIAASTRDGEEALVLDALAASSALPPATLTIIVPRHPQRFDEVAHLLTTRGVEFVRRSAGASPAATTAVLLGDTLGELFAYYVAADVAFVGGSLLPLGGQNLLEPIAAGVPTLVGPHTFNFAEVTEDLIKAGAVMRIPDGDALGPAVVRLLSRDIERRTMGEAARRVMERERGAVERTMAIVERVLGGEFD
jgi:3-deoxy-D-manno-octulosonic-acid transferase